MLKRVLLLGVLGERFGREWELAIRTPLEAIRAIGCQVQGFNQFLYESGEAGIEYQVVTDNPQGCLVEELGFPFCADTVVIAPVMQGSGGAARLIAGAVLIAVAFAVPGGVLGLSAATIGLLGASLVLSGISQLLTRTPESPDEAERSSSAIIDTAARTTDQGRPVPKLFGRRRIDCRIVLSSGVDVEKVRDSDDD